MNCFPFINLCRIQGFAKYTCMLVGKTSTTKSIPSASIVILSSSSVVRTINLLRVSNSVITYSCKILTCASDMHIFLVVAIWFWGIFALAQAFFTSLALDIVHKNFLNCFESHLLNWRQRARICLIVKSKVAIHWLTKYLSWCCIKVIITDRPPFLSVEELSSSTHAAIYYLRLEYSKILIFR